MENDTIKLIKNQKSKMNKDNVSERQSPRQSQMTMTTLAGEVKIRLAGTGTATINWGDGSENTTHNLTPFEKKKGYK
jgi:hypothetical protein